MASRIQVEQIARSLAALGLLATIAVAQQNSKGLLWICGGDAELLQHHWSGATELLQLEGDLQLQALLDLAAGVSSD